MRLWGLGVLGFVASAALGARAGATPAAHTAAGARPAHRAPACPIAARVEVAVPDDVDEVRAIVDGAAPGAAAVTVLGGGSDRELEVYVAGDAAARGQAGAIWGLQLQRPLPAGRVIVAVEPVLDAPSSACVEHVELLRRGAVVARVAVAR